MSIVWCVVVDILFSCPATFRTVRMNVAFELLPSWRGTLVPVKQRWRWRVHGCGLVVHCLAYCRLGIVVALLRTHFGLDVIVCTGAAAMRCSCVFTPLIRRFWLRAILLDHRRRRRGPRRVAWLYLAGVELLLNQFSEHDQSTWV